MVIRVLSCTARLFYSGVGIFAKMASGSLKDKFQDPETIVENNFRVLLTRARKEMIPLIPEDTILDETFQYFINMGMDQL